MPPTTPPTLPTATTQALSQLSLSTTKTTDVPTDTTTVSSPQTTATPLHIRSDSIESTTSTSDGHDLVKRDMDFFLARLARRGQQ